MEFLTDPYHLCCEQRIIFSLKEMKITQQGEKQIDHFTDFAFFFPLEFFFSCSSRALIFYQADLKKIHRMGIFLATCY
jgi:hypothetical protein